MPETMRRIAGALDDLSAKHRFLTDSLGGGHREDAADRLIQALDADGRRLAGLLRDPARARFTWLLLPERLSLDEARDGVGALVAAGIPVAEVVINRATPAAPGPCAHCEVRRAAEADVIAATRAAFPKIPLRVLPGLEREPSGLVALRRLGRRLAGDSPPDVAPHAGRVSRARRLPRKDLPPASWLDRVAPVGVRLVVFTGKGGVGKTTCAAATAVTLAAVRPQARVLALSVDPAHSLGDVLDTTLADTDGEVPGAPAGLRARELDADRAFAELRARYQDAVERTFAALLRGSRFDVAYDREALRGLMDLAPPGLDELFAVLTIVEVLLEQDPPADVVVLDTAPTGHALRLFQMPATALGWVHALLAILLKYRDVVGLGELAAELLASARRLRELTALLTDDARARVVVVTRPAELPDRETERLLDRLRRLRLAVPAVVVNAVTPEGCRRCIRLRRVEQRLVARLCRRRATRRQRWGIISTPALAPPPRGARALALWARTWKPE
jgi:arsenite-transporting ATPase